MLVFAPSVTVCPTEFQLLSDRQVNGFFQFADQADVRPGAGVTCGAAGAVPGPGSAGTTIAGAAGAAGAAGVAGVTGETGTAGAAAGSAPVVRAPPR